MEILTERQIRLIYEILKRGHSVEIKPRNGSVIILEVARQIKT